MSDKGRGTRDRARAREAAIEALQVRHVDDIAPKHYQQGQRYGLEVGYIAGYEAAIAAERERIVAALEKEKDDELFDTPFDIVMDRAIEIVKGEENNGDHCG